MGRRNKENVQLVISHLEGCSGNFLGRLAANLNLENQSAYRVDVNLHTSVIAVNQCTSTELEKLEQHKIVVTHNYNQEYLRSLFPNAKLIQIYPYSHVGNVLHNICFKKLNTTMTNKIDNYLLQIKEWHQHIQKNKPMLPCTDFWELSDPSKVESLLGSALSTEQMMFFDRYWAAQIPVELNMPQGPATIKQLISQWGIDQYFDDWFIAWTIYVYEYINNLNECQRTWSIDTDIFESWEQLSNIEIRYNNMLTNPDKLLHNTNIC